MTAETTPRRKRPVTVTLAVVLVYLTALLSVVIGVFVLLSRYDVAEAEVFAVSLLGVAIILLGLLAIGVASGLSRGSKLARLAVTAYLGLLVVLHLVSIVTTEQWDAAGVVQIMIQVAILVALWAPPGSRFFVSSAVRAAEELEAN